MNTTRTPALRAALLAAMLPTLLLGGAGCAGMSQDEQNGTVGGGVIGGVLGGLAGAAIDKKDRGRGAVATVRGYTGDGRRGLRVMPVSVRAYAEEWEKLDRLRELAEQGAITLRVAGTYPAEKAADAHRRLAAGGTRGRLVLRFA